MQTQLEQMVHEAEGATIAAGTAPSKLAHPYPEVAGVALSSVTYVCVKCSVVFTAYLRNTTAKIPQDRAAKMVRAAGWRFLERGWTCGVCAKSVHDG